MTFIHPTALVSSNAKIGEDCYIGAFSTIGDEVELAQKVRHLIHTSSLTAKLLLTKLRTFSLLFPSV
ncbi:MAG: hypothetical protein HC846_02325 [Blastocatellia bacterium]|nr:hypothetical protein [Blastocatellia bacterium]